MPSTAAGTQATVHLIWLSPRDAVDESDGHRRHPDFEPPKEPDHERIPAARLLQLYQLPGRNPHLWLPAAGCRRVQLRGELLLRQDLRLQQGLCLRQELMTNPPRGASRGTPRHRQECPMKNLLQNLASLLARLRTPSIEEQYLAQAVDARDLQIRLLVLERAQP
jgi:hypothetical protein